MSRDLSESEFWTRCRKNGMRPALMGYVNVTRNVSVCRYNAGDRRRDQLAYLLKEQHEAVERHGETT